MKLIPKDEAFPAEREERERKRKGKRRERNGRGRKTPSREPNQTDGTLPDHVWMPSIAPKPNTVFWGEDGENSLKNTLK